MIAIRMATPASDAASAGRSSSGRPSRAPCHGSATAPPATTTSTTSTATGGGQRRAFDLEPAQQQRGPALPLPVDWRRERGDEQRCALAAGRRRAAGACGGLRDGEVWKGCEARRRGTCLSVEPHLRWGGAGFKPAPRNPGAGSAPARRLRRAAARRRRRRRWLEATRWQGERQAARVPRARAAQRALLMPLPPTPTLTC